MALSDEEQRLLDQMEAALEAEDPKLASALRGSTRQLHHRRLIISGLGFALGVAALIGGMEVHPVLSVIGFVIMLAAAAIGVTAWQQSGVAADGAGGKGNSERDFMGKMEERWRRRQDEGF
ncbi:MAG TPA: DUF3040 domain-containing protein [Propionicimonas sp.]|nr:DUF3040 domain-containing protein [Propionicimonas sp.]HRA06050.1 DUF3040 domain-containing protein [Propionicimonas sp.]